MDYRLPKNRREAYIRWHVWALLTYDCDPVIYSMKYIFNRMELNIEQRLWICWLYGTTYQLPTAWVIANEFPDFENVDLDRLTEWNNKNYSRLRYQVDTKWNKGHLPRMFESYRKNIGDQTQQQFFGSICSHEDRIQNFMSLYNYIIDNFYKFGRYSAWFYLQVLRDVCNIPIDANSLKFYDEGSKSHRAGMCYVVAKDEWSVKHRKFNKEETNFLESEIQSMMLEMKERFPNIEIEPFGIETTLCSFKKIFRKSRGRYLGYYLDRMAEDISKVEADKWNGIDWSLLWQCRDEILHPSTNCKKVSSKKMEYFLDHGSWENLDLIFGEK